MEKTSNIPRFRMSQAALTRTATAYNRIADHIRDSPLAYRDRFGRATVDGMHLAPGSTVLDIGCAAGSTALAAAERVGAVGRVVAVDIAQDLLAVGRRRAEERGLGNVEFMCADMTNLPFPDEHFDGITSVFSIFFSDDIQGLVNELWRMLKPGGKLAIRTWGPSVFEPLDTLLHQAAIIELPDLYRGPTAMDFVKFPEQIDKIMRAAGAVRVEVVAETGRNYLPAPEDWWTMAMGSGLRRIIASLSEEGKVRVRERLFQSIREAGATAVITDTVYGVATKAA